MWRHRAEAVTQTSIRKGLEKAVALELNLGEPIGKTKWKGSEA